MALVQHAPGRARPNLRQRSREEPAGTRADQRQDDAAAPAHPSRSASGPSVEDPAAAPLLGPRTPGGRSPRHVGRMRLVAWFVGLAVCVVLPAALSVVLAPPQQPTPSAGHGEAVFGPGAVFATSAMTVGNRTGGAPQQIVAVSTGAEIALLVVPMVLAVAVVLAAWCCVEEAEQLLWLLFAAAVVVIPLLVLLPVWLFVPLDAGDHAALLAAITLPALLALLALGMPWVLSTPECAPMHRCTDEHAHGARAGLERRGR